MADADADILSYITTAQAFIASHVQLRSSGEYGGFKVMEGQANHMAQRLKSMSMDLTTATKCLALIREGPWSPGQKESLADAVNSSTMNHSLKGVPTISRKSTQNLLSLENFAIQSDYDTLTSSEASRCSKVQVLAKIMTRVKCVNPSESTVRKAVELLAKMRVIDPNDSSVLYSCVKDVKRYVKFESASTQLISVHLKDYPIMPRDLPADHFHAAYSTHPPVVMEIPEAQIPFHVPLRCTNRTVRPDAVMVAQNSSPADMFGQMMQMMQTMANGGDGRRAPTIRILQPGHRGIEPDRAAAAAAGVAPQSHALESFAATEPGAAGRATEGYQPALEMPVLGISPAEQARLIDAASSRTDASMAGGTDVKPAAKGTPSAKAKAAGKGKAAAKGKGKPAAKAKSSTTAKPVAKVQTKTKAMSVGITRSADEVRKLCKNKVPGMALRMKLAPNGCPKCREKKAGCFDSCWKYRLNLKA
jgi:hypothetical protein